jgi:ribosomal protein L40E
MWNKKKITGIFFAVAGVFLTRIDVFTQIENNMVFSLNALGILLAFTGIAIYASGMPRTLQKVRVCPFCYAKNEVSAKTCKQCRKALPKKAQ